MPENISPKQSSTTIFVPDTSAILTGKIDIFSLNSIVPESVLNEIRKGKESRIYNEGLHILKTATPTQQSVEIVREAAKSSGDISFLSSTDIDVIAIALEVKGVILSDDYSLQNVASKLNIAFKPCGLKGIEKQIKWEFRCRACGLRRSERVEFCPVCGHVMTRYPVQKQ